jgi:uncharacterized protein (UPF0305 family)
MIVDKVISIAVKCNSCGVVVLVTLKGAGVVLKQLGWWGGEEIRNDFNVHYCPICGWLRKN